MHRLYAALSPIPGMNLNDLFPELEGGDPLRHRDALGAQPHQLRAPGKVQHRHLGTTGGRFCRRPRIRAYCRRLRTSLLPRKPRMSPLETRGVTGAHSRPPGGTHLAAHGAAVRSPAPSASRRPPRVGPAHRLRPAAAAPAPGFRQGRAAFRGVRFGMACKFLEQDLKRQILRWVQPLQVVADVMRSVHGTSHTFIFIIDIPNITKPRVC